jgi:hypothetical protein
MLLDIREIIVHLITLFDYGVKAGFIIDFNGKKTGADNLIIEVQNIDDREILKFYTTGEGVRYESLVYVRLSRSITATRHKYS